MRTIDRLVVLLRSWFGAGRMDAEFSEELQDHLDRQMHANLAAGMSGPEARRAAHLSLGHVEGIREEARSARAGAALRQVIRDALYGVRLVRRAPGFAFTGIAIVALGIAATTAIFSVVYGVVLRPLPYSQPERLVNVWLVSRQLALPRMQVTAVDHREWQASNHVFSDIAIVRQLANFNLTGDGEPERLFATLAAPNLFRILGVTPALGRTFTDEEGTLGHERVVLLSDGLWKRRFGEDRKILGRTITLNGVSHTVVGVMKPDFHYPGREIQIWTPLAIDPAELADRLGNNYVALARLKPGVTLSQAQSEMDVIRRQQLATMNPVLFRTLQGSVQVVDVVPLIEQTVGGVRQTLYVLLGAVCCLLLIACLNLASLLAARTAARAREFAVRLALGASRARLAMQAMAEVAPIVGIGGLLGMAIATGAVAAFVPLAPATLPRTESIGVSLPVLLFSVTTLGLTALMGALLSAVQAWQSDFTTVTRNESRSATTGLRQSRARNLLVVTQIALVLPLLVGASLLTRSLSALSRVDPGFRPDNVLSLQLAIPRSKYPKDADVAAFSGRLVERVAEIPGVESASMVNRLPLAGVGQINPMAFEGTETVASPLSTDTRTVTPDYFRTLGISLIEGRSFTSRDTEASAPVAIIDDRVARALWPGQSALGHRVRFPFGDLPWSEVVGVVGHIRHDGLDTDPRPQVYFNYLQRAQDRMALVVRGGGNVGTLVPSVLQAIREIDRDQPVYDVRTMRDVVERSTAQQWLSRTLVTTFALIALLLAAVGLYGLISYGVTRQAREFGVRLALGATRTGIARLVLGRAGLLAVSGIGLGLIVAFVVTRAMQSLLFGVGTGDPLSFGIAVATLVAVALVSSYIPARRAASVDPAVTLRAD